MDFTRSEEQTALQDMLSRFVEKDYSFAHRQSLKDSAEGFSRENWARFADLGILGLPFPEEHGGIGGNALDVMLVMEILGRGLVLEPYLTTVVLAGGLIRDAGSAAQKEVLLPPIIEGSLLMTLAHYEAGSRYQLNQVATTAVVAGTGWTLSGSKAAVVGAPCADKLIVSARTSGTKGDEHGISLFEVAKAAPGVTLTPYPTQDGGRAADIRFENVVLGGDALIGAKDEALPTIAKAIDYANAALCAEAVGIMAALTGVTLEYLKTRKQFGVPIGQFQALKHRMADMYIANEQSRSMMYLAAAKSDSPDTRERQRVVSAAKALIGRCARFVGQDAVQLHGGMGVTDELIVGHYFKRLTMINATFGDADHHLGRFSDSMLAT